MRKQQDPVQHHTDHDSVRCTSRRRIECQTDHVTTGTDNNHGCRSGQHLTGCRAACRPGSSHDHYCRGATTGTGRDSDAPACGRSARAEIDGQLRILR